MKMKKIGPDQGVPVAAQAPHNVEDKEMRTNEPKKIPIKIISPILVMLTFVPSIST